MKLITQKDPLGCGVACVANAITTNYKSTKKLFPKSENGFLCKDIVNALYKVGIKAEYSYVGNKKIGYKEKDIVFIKRSKLYPYGHYLIRIKNKWADSWINFRDNSDVIFAKAGYRKRLPGKAIYLIRLVI